jgi:hypothetical protein
LYNFDSTTSVPTGWAAGPGYGTTDLAGANAATTAYSGTEKNQCTGSLKATFPFTSYALFTTGQATQESGVLQYTGASNWTGKTKLHAWVKVDSASGVNHIGFLQFFASSTTGGYQSVVDGGTWWTGAWHEIVWTLPATGWDKATVNNYGLQVNLKSAAPTGGPATPTTTVVYLDDVWVE